MSWLNTILDVTSVAINIANSQKLEELKLQGATAQVVQAVLNMLRDQVFGFRQAAEDILASNTASPKVAAGAMKILEARVEASQISPEMFPTLSDKDYVATTYRFIRTEGQRLLGQLTTEDQQDVYQAVESARAHEGVSYYLGQYDTARQLIAAQQTVGELAGRNSTAARFGLGFGAVLLAFLAAGAAVGGGDAGILLFILAGGLLFGLSRFLRAKEYQSARKTVDELDDKVDLDEWNKLQRVYNDDRQRAKQDQSYHKSVLDNFMADLPLPASLPISAVAPMVERVDPDSLAVIDEPVAQNPVQELPEEQEVMMASPQPAVLTYCWNCGGKLPEGAVFCPACGKGKMSLTSS